MRRMILLSVICVFILSQVVMAVPPIKFDLTLFFGLSKYTGIGNSEIDAAATPFGGTGPYNMNLMVDSLSGGFMWDVIFLTSEKNYYGHGISLLVDIAVMNQGFGSLLMTNGQQVGTITNGSFIGRADSVQLYTIMNIKIAPMYRFHVTRDFNIGIGPAINIVGVGNANFIVSDAYTGGADNPEKGLSNYYIQPQFGTISVSLLADIQITKFFGNFGVTASLFGEALLSPIVFGFGARFGVKYRFSP